jgi:hypothetical protein
MAIRLAMKSNRALLELAPVASFTRVISRADTCPAITTRRVPIPPLPSAQVAGLMAIRLAMKTNRALLEVAPVASFTKVYGGLTLVQPLRQAAI